MEDNEYGLSQEEQTILDAVLTNTTRAGAAGALGISYATLYRRLQRPHLRAAIDAARREQIAAATGSLQVMAHEAVATLGEIMADPTVAAHVRVTAARAIIEQALKAYETDNLEARLQEMERAYA
ncbi:MAG: hypothetical protein ACFB50_09705 [Rubrobacteraceae bacterium]